MKVLTGDIETDDLLDGLTKLHCAVFYDPDAGKEYRFTNMKTLGKFLDEYKDYYLVIHNGICFDVPALEKLGYKVKNKIIDTLPLSYYLYLNQQRHGLQYWGEVLGIAKPEVEDWKNLTLDQYLHRCSEDVKIQTALFDKFWPRMLDIYGSEKKALKMVSYLNWKMHQQRIQENNKIKLDMHGALKLLSTLEELKEKKTAELESVMPPVPIIKVKKRPKVMFKMNGDPSAHNLKWQEFLKDQGLTEEEAEAKIEKAGGIPYEDGYKEPNSGSHQQVKEWLYGLGWKPETIKKVKENKDPEEYEAEKKAARDAVRGTRRRPKWVKPYTEREIHQILTEDKDICPSIVKLAEDVPEVRALEGLGVINHRIGIVKGFIESANKRGGYLQARAHAFTNTLRLKHTELVNIPSGRKAWGKEIRSLLVADEGKCFLGSDLSSLEDRLKHHFQWPLDPEYVKSQMSKDFDPHLLVARQANLLTSSEEEFYKWYKSKN